MLTTMLLGSTVTLTDSCSRLLSFITGKGWLFMLENVICRLATFIVPPFTSLKLTIHIWYPSTRLKSTLYEKKITTRAYPYRRSVERKGWVDHRNSGCFSDISLGPCPSTGRPRAGKICSGWTRRRRRSSRRPGVAEGRRAGSAETRRQKVHGPRRAGVVVAVESGGGDVTRRPLCQSRRPQRSGVRGIAAGAPEEGYDSRWRLRTETHDNW